MTPSERFWANVPLGNAGGCWPWQGAVSSNGYGEFRPAGRSRGPVSSHRFAYEDRVGPIPQGSQVLHTCDNRVCVNPTHLFLGTNRDNLVDRNRKGRGANGFGPHTSREVRLAVRERTDLSCRQAAALFGISPSTVSNIRRGVTPMDFYTDEVSA